eukprot:Amastigsp_a339_181.p3 type:complete len:130 gc:universal Amastigsp_a339_181:723-1112(+)
MQDWPALMNLPQSTRRAATVRSESSATITGDLPPSSSVTGVRCFAAAAMMMRPTAVEPVYEMWSNRSSRISVVSAAPQTTARMASESMYRGNSSASTAEVLTETSESLDSEQLPAAIEEISGRNTSALG